ncbi:hypothetical protein MHC_01585 [Mycoplasma haemocanis str. Illinois]|uniref:Uncharacterized protein n=1 Tax=Mycoplasma haemocanis (strain Illinois) TaxID=1111676 RepID=H6N6B1_MYCHN|nr:hypothetical protein [Mycoplasma haemocanis]AEW45183.1 hypothetical protein MHC_01585 [Mycoplasma haemocanis str. Illinois]
MPKLPLIGSVAIIGGVGGLSWELSKPSRKIAAISSKKPLPIKRCELFSIVRSSDRTVKREDESSFRKTVTDNDFWEKVDKDCKTKEKLYVAFRNQKWVYEEADQDGVWNVTN